MKKPNIVMIVADQWRADSLGYTNNEACFTPNIDELVEDGVGFTNAYCQATVCVPSRASFISGMYPHTKGYRTMHHLMSEDDPNILRTLKNEGYHVYWGGRNDFLRTDVDVDSYCDTRDDQFYEYFKQVMSNSQGKQGKSADNNDLKTDYSFYKGIVNRDPIDKVQIESAIDFLDKKKYGDSPFCMYIALSLPHPDYQTSQQWYDKINKDLVPNPVRLTEEELSNKPSMLRGIRKNQKIYNLSDEQLKEIKHVYYAMGTELDHYIGQLIDKLKSENLYDDTWVIFFSDHGDYTGDYEIVEKSQNTFEDCLTNVPLVIKPAKNIDFKSRITDAMVELIDIQATLLDVLNITPTYTHFGKSLVSVLAGNDVHRDVVFSEGGRTAGESYHSMDAGHSPANPYWARTTEQEKIPQHTKAMMIRSKNYKYVYRLYEDDEFYVLDDDPMERKNRINDEKYQHIIAKYKNRMLRHFFETGDLVPQRRDSRY